MNLEEADRLLSVSDDYRLLRRIPSPSRWTEPANGETRRAIFLDTETTGLDLDHDEVIELAIVAFEYEHATGRIVKQGWFHAEHRTLSDAMAGLFLLSLPLPQSQRLTLAALLDCARRPLKAVRAEDTPCALRTALKQRGYQWDAGNDERSKAWWILTSAPEEEVAWLNAEIYPSLRELPVISVPATRRYSSRVWRNGS